jgi:hypothetical protein
MNTEAVMCMALTRQSPSFTPDSETVLSTFGVMFTNSMRLDVLNVRWTVCDFMRGLP